jgi:hypothetical protein
VYLSGDARGAGRQPSALPHAVQRADTRLPARPFRSRPRTGQSRTHRSRHSLDAASRERTGTHQAPGLVIAREQSPPPRAMILLAGRWKTCPCRRLAHGNRVDGRALYGDSGGNVAGQAMRPGRGDTQVLRQKSRSDEPDRRALFAPDDGSSESDLVLAKSRRTTRAVSTGEPRNGIAWNRCHSRSFVSIAQPRLASISITT